MELSDLRSFSANEIDQVDGNETSFGKDKIQYTNIAKINYVVTTLGSFRIRKLGRELIINK